MTGTTKRVEQFGGPSDVGYRQAVSAYDLAVVVDPAGALTARSVEDARSAVRAAADSGRRLGVMTTGHGASMLSPDLAAIDLIKTDLQAPIRVDEERGTVTFPAGATVQRVAEAVAKHGRAIRHGSSGGIGAVG